MRLMLLLLPLSLMFGCLPNPQSEWTSSEGGDQRSTLEDPTIALGSTFPDGLDTDWVWDTSGHRHQVTHVGHGAHIGHATHVAHAHVSSHHH